MDAIDLHHEDLPDPVVEMFRCLQRRMDRLEHKLVEGGTLEPADHDLIVTEQEDGSMTVEFEGWTWEI